jgi:hypothetical protein
MTNHDDARLAHEIRIAHARSGQCSTHVRFVFGLSYGRTTDGKLEALVDEANQRKMVAN